MIINGVTEPFTNITVRFINDKKVIASSKSAADGKFTLELPIFVRTTSDIVTWGGELYGVFFTNPLKQEGLVAVPITSDIIPYSKKYEVEGELKVLLKQKDSLKKITKDPWKDDDRFGSISWNKQKRVFVYSEQNTPEVQPKPVVKKNTQSFFELKGQTLNNGKPLAGVEIEVSGPLIGYGDNILRYISLKTGNYNIKIPIKNFHKYPSGQDYKYDAGCYWYYVTFSKDGFVRKTATVNPFISAKTDSDVFVYSLLVEMLPDNSGKNSDFLWKDISWNIHKHEFDTLKLSKRSMVKDTARDKNDFSLKAGKPITLLNILFESNKSTLQKSSFDELNKLADYLNKNRMTAIEISGHTDNTGNADANLKLSQDRANAVRDYLIKRAIAANRVIAKGYGDTKPVASNDTEEGRSKNRRIEVKMIKE